MIILDFINFIVIPIYKLATPLLSLLKQPMIITNNNPSLTNHQVSESPTKISNSLQPCGKAHKASICQPTQNCLLKFIDNVSSNRRSKVGGIKCLFNNTYAVSSDSPDHFKLDNTIVMRSNGSKIINSPSNPNPESACASTNKLDDSQRFRANKNYFRVNDSSTSELFIPQYMRTIKLEPKPFNIKKSDHTGFIQNNIASQWNQQYPLMGDERSIEARRLKNVTRQKIIDQKRKTRQSFLRTFYQERRKGPQNYFRQLDENNKKSLTGNKSRSSQIIGRKINSALFTSKVKVRSDRNFLANKLHEQTKSYLIKDQSPQNIDRQFYSTQYCGRKDERKVFFAESRPTTGKKSSMSKSKGKREQRLGQIVKQFGSRQQKGHKRAHSTLQVTNVTQENSEQMVSKIQEWANKTHMRKLLQCQNLTKQQALVKKVKNYNRQFLM